MHFEGIFKASGPLLLMWMDNLISRVDLLAALARVPKRLTNLCLGEGFIVEITIEIIDIVLKGSQLGSSQFLWLIWQRGIFP